jgi:hypothetical protein
MDYKAAAQPPHVQHYFCTDSTLLLLLLLLLLLRAGINLWDEHIPDRTLVVLGGKDILSPSAQVGRWLREHTRAHVRLGGGQGLLVLQCLHPVKSILCHACHSYFYTNDAPAHC